MPWLLLTHAAALLLFWWLPEWAAPRDAALFTANLTSDDYHGVFHRQRLTERLGIAAGVALVASAPLLLGQAMSALSYFVSVLALLCAAGGLWAYRFNPLLNVARALPYVPEYYVSADPRAARFPDRWLWARAVRAIPAGAFNDAELHQERARYAAKELRTLLRVALGAGLAAWATGLAFILYHGS